MSDPQNAYQRGMEVMREVYAGDVVDLPEGFTPLNDVMQRTLFAEVWSRDVLSIRDRRLLAMGVLVSRGVPETWRTQARAALRRGEVEPDELRETLVFLAQYAGYAQISAFVLPCEELIQEFEAEQASGDRSGSSSMEGLVRDAGLELPSTDETTPES